MPRSRKIRSTLLSATTSLVVVGLVFLGVSGALPMIAALADTLKAWRDRPLDLIYGMLDTKGAAGFLAPLAPLADSLKAVRIPGEAASLTAEAAAAQAVQAGIEAAPADSVMAALKAIVEAADRPGRILICGSLYLAGQVLAENG